MSAQPYSDEDVYEMAKIVQEKWGVAGWLRAQQIAADALRWRDAALVAKAAQLDAAVARAERVEGAARDMFARVRRDGCLYCVCGRLMQGNSAHDPSCAWEALRLALPDTTRAGDSEGGV